MANRSPVRAAVRLAAVALAATAAAPVAPAVDNPQYAAWARARVGTSVTLVSDTDASLHRHVRMELTLTLRAVTADGATVATSARAAVNGHVEPPDPPMVQLIPAKVPAADMQRTGTADVEAMGRTFACGVYAVATTAANGAVTRATAYLNPDVPGGVVKLVTPLSTGKVLTFVLTGIAAK